MILRVFWENIAFGSLDSEEVNLEIDGFEEIYCMFYWGFGDWKIWKVWKYIEFIQH